MAKPNKAPTPTKVETAGLGASVDIAGDAPIVGPVSGAGNLSPEDLAAIHGAVPMTATEMLTSGAPASADHAPMGEQPEATDEEVHFGARLLTLERRCGDLEAAMEKWAGMLSQRLAETPRHATGIAAPIRPASVAEENAYCAANYDLRNAGQTPWDGIQAWRDAGSPGLAA